MGYFRFSHVYNQQQRKLEREEEKGCVCGSGSVLSAGSVLLLPTVADWTRGFSTMRLLYWILWKLQLQQACILEYIDWFV